MVTLTALTTRPRQILSKDIFINLIVYYTKRSLRHLALSNSGLSAFHAWCCGQMEATSWQLLFWGSQPPYWIVYSSDQFSSLREMILPDFLESSIFMIVFLPLNYDYFMMKSHNRNFITGKRKLFTYSIVVILFFKPILFHYLLSIHYRFMSFDS